MTKPKCDRIPKTTIQLNGFIEEYLCGITEQWLLVAPKANPAMLEMFRDRDASPLREMIPWAGEFAGKYLTGAVQVLRVTGDVRLKTWLKEFVSRLISFQDKDGYLGPWPKQFHLTNTSKNSIHGDGIVADTWGHYHIMLGLLLWYEETHDKDTLACVISIADLICSKYLGRKNIRLVDTGRKEFNMAPVHSLAILYCKTGVQKYLNMALQIVDEFTAYGKDGIRAGDYLRQALDGKEFFQTPLPRWESLHPIMGLAELYWITGEEKYRQAFEQIWWSIVKLDRHNNGGFTSGEQATGNPYNFGAIESCCTIAWIALSVEMLKMTNSSVVADEIELSTLNSIVGMHSATGRWCTYNTPMNGLRRSFATDLNFQNREGSPELNCCSVNTPRGFGMISDWGLMKDDEGLILNYYGPSVMTAKVKPGLSVTLTQKTEYPVSGRIDLRVTPSNAVKFTLKLRIPYWSRNTTVKLNGNAISDVQADQYLTISRNWKSNDKIEIDLDMSLHFWIGEKDCEGLTSVYRGPILLAYDHRYNLQHAAKGEAEVRDPTKWKPTDCMLKPPLLDARNMKPKQVKWDDWLPPVLLLEFNSTDGKIVRLCDYGSAGEAGTPYLSWLPIKNTPPKAKFSQSNPLRSGRFRSEL